MTLHHADRGQTPLSRFLLASYGYFALESGLDSSPSVAPSSLIWNGRVRHVEDPQRVCADRVTRLDWLVLPNPHRHLPKGGSIDAGSSLSGAAKLAVVGFVPDLLWLVL